jgi:hypothetical protein
MELHNVHAKIYQNSLAVLDETCGQGDTIIPECLHYVLTVILCIV